ncbi:MAG: nicotinamidase [Deltaproteobacteria bacterium RIFCSPLOWO2_12_FULL_43_16]|nr:MAG: nicotinamidase [Deltaproteobacteria bacterium GWA2_43_19]OGQ12776.1 MAG: nicotinamidase [Deltaproteobacteria bacterium RIFCSPHIGHO2_02_FULL_43_33]OGQ57102.1 MAG: nicotinamidase [Deltaproteobacteria bacterium RIFCSPLOWO2_12_FULL_43_16]HBR16487.1 bifunctional nicotinamidase/pyrazinamidase [Deltaproteobacteria bacterium]
MTKSSALVIVDVQNDFCPGGALPVPEGDKVVPVLNKYIQRFQKAGLPIYASRDWHPEKTKHFKAFGGLWPPHCVQGTKGAAFHPDLKLPKDTIILTKGEDPNEDSYSCFQAHDSEGKPFIQNLKVQWIKHLYVGGLATDYCVKATVLDGLKHGFQVTVLTDAVRGVDVKTGDSAAALKEMRTAGAEETTLEDLKL